MARAVRAAQQYILTSPEAHTTGIARSTENERQITGYESKPRGPYKAVVFLMMAGGMDTYNLLVPKCADAYAEYAAARGAHALPLHNLKSIYTTGQECSEFGVHSDFPLLADMSNETVFFANLGTLSKPLTKHDKWNKESNMQLFAHNAMSHELYEETHMVKPKQRAYLAASLICCRSRVTTHQPIMFTATKTCLLAFQRTRIPFPRSH